MPLPTSFSGPQRWYAIGGHVSIIAIIVLAAIALPALRRLAKLAHSTATADALPSASARAESERLSKRVALAVQLPAVMLVITMTLMAVGRYV